MGLSRFQGIVHSYCNGLPLFTPESPIIRFWVTSILKYQLVSPEKNANSLGLNRIKPLFFQRPYSQRVKHTLIHQIHEADWLG
jgi:hypothetical protein